MQNHIPGFQDSIKVKLKRITITALSQLTHQNIYSHLDGSWHKPIELGRALFRKSKLLVI